jgi:hypothetical protein
MTTEALRLANQPEHNSSAPCICRRSGFGRPKFGNISTFLRSVQLAASAPADGAHPMRLHRECAFRCLRQRKQARLGQRAMWGALCLCVGSVLLLRSSELAMMQPD